MYKFKCLLQVPFNIQQTFLLISKIVIAKLILFLILIYVTLRLLNELTIKKFFYSRA